MKIINLLDNASIVEDYEVVDFRKWETGLYYKINVRVIDNSELYIKEYIDCEERKYSFHWQNEKNELIIRWDNAPYYSEVATYPHHKHKENKDLSSKEVSIKEVLEYIENNISGQ